MDKLKILLCAASLLSACSFSTGSADIGSPLALPKIPQQLRACDGPEPVDMGKAEAGFYSPEALYKGWARDRTRLAVCRKRHSAVVSYYDSLILNLNMETDPE